MATAVTAVPAAALAPAAQTPAAARTSPPAAHSMAQPAVSPDGSRIAFVSGGDIWTVPSAGGAARLLVSHPGEDTRPLWSPDGRHLAFQSDREGGDDDIHVLELATGEVRRLTFYDDSEWLDAWSADGAFLHFTSGRRDPGGLGDLYRIPLEGGTPVLVSGDRYNAEFHGAPSPEGERVALVGGGRMAQGQWWRNGSSHIDETEIWLMEPGDPAEYRRLTVGGKNLWPQWLPDGETLLFMSDRSGSENLWTLPADGGEATSITDFQQGRVLWPSVAADGSLVAFERDFGIWTLAPGGTASPLEVRLEGALVQEGVERLSLTSGFSDLALSPDGKKVAFVARGEVFAAATGRGADEDLAGGEAVRITRTAEEESGVVWAPDSRRLAYVSLRSGSPSIVVHDFASGEETLVTGGEASVTGGETAGARTAQSGSDNADMTPRFSPDGDFLAYVRNGTELRVVELASGEDRLVTRAQLWKHPFDGAEPLAWSPDGEWLAFLATDRRMFTNAWVVPAEGGEARPITGLANSFAGSLAWAPDGERFYLDSQHRTVTGQLLEVDLVPRAPRFREDRFQALFDTPGTSEASGGEETDGEAEEDEDEVTVAIDFPEIRRRVRPLPTGVDAGVLSLSPDGKTLVFTASAEGRTNLYALSVDPQGEGPRVARQLTSTSGGKSRPLFTPDGEEVWYLDAGRIRAVKVASGQDRALAVTAAMDVPVRELRMAAFRQGWRYMRDHFYDPDFHGTDWDAVRETFAPRIAGAGSDGEMTRLMNLMVGELDASHLGYSRSGGSGPTTGDLGVRWDPGTLAADGTHRVAEVIPLGPAALAGILPGEVLLALDGESLGEGSGVNRLLEGRVGDKAVARVRGEEGVREVEVQPVNAGAARQLAYGAWVESRRAHVDRVSGGRLGYVHMPSMGWDAYQQLLVDLDAENHQREGVVIDIRDNNGGFVNVYALDVFSRQGYLTMETRGYPEAPARSMLGQRSLEAPTVLVVNQNTLSDGEDFTEGYRALELGPVVGQPTAGWIVFTWNLSLVDGASFRIPRSRIRGAAGDDMERVPRPVDIPVEKPLGESLRGADAQLDAAVAALLARLEG